MPMIETTYVYYARGDNHSYGNPKSTSQGQPVALASQKWYRIGSDAPFILTYVLLLGSSTRHCSLAEFFLFGIR
jgi:hypothetical protein